MSNSLKAIAAIAGISFACASFAESPAASLSRIEEETMILKAREKQLDVQAKIIARQSEIASRQSESERIAHSPVAGNPLIEAIEGIGKTLHASLRMDNGNVLDAQVGDVLDNGMKVVTIRSHEVIVETAGKRRVRLAAASRAPIAFNPNFPGPGVSFPPLPTLPALPNGAPK